MRMNNPMVFPIVVFGTTSPYPTVVIVAITNHRLLNRLFMLGSNMYNASEEKIMTNQDKSFLRRLQLSQRTVKIVQPP